MRFLKAENARPGADHCQSDMQELILHAQAPATGGVADSGIQRLSQRPQKVRFPQELLRFGREILFQG